MIQANELRFGNNLHDFNGKIVEVTSVNKTGVRCTFDRIDNRKQHTSLYDLSELHPIPITPEILDRIGTRHSALDSTSTYWLVGKLGFLYCLEDYQLEQGLHWFQNYHYFRTGEELNYTP